jgi:hypothetical protein
MGEISIEEDCFAPRRTRWIEYSGPDPFAIAREGRDILKPVFEIGTSSTGEPRFMWDWTGDPVQLYLHLMAKKTYSAYTVFWISIRIVGFKSKSRNEGTFRMEIEPVLRHKLKGNKLTMFLWWIYWYAFYNKIRQSMKYRCEEMAETFMTAVKNMYHLGTFQEEIWLP